MSASEIPAEQAIANYLATGRIPAFEPYPLPVIGRDGCRDVAISYWGADLQCSCCSETKPRRWVDHYRGDLGECQACHRDLQLAPCAKGTRCQVHRAWDREQRIKEEEAKAKRKGKQSSPNGQPRWLRA